MSEENENKLEDLTEGLFQAFRVGAMPMNMEVHHLKEIFPGVADEILSSGLEAAKNRLWDYMMTGREIDDKD